MKKLRNTYLFMRHAEAVLNRRNIVCSDLKKYPLTPRGRLVARQAGRLVAKKYRPHLIYTSPVRRARETAHLVASLCRASVQTIKEFRELYFGRYENKPVALYRASRRTALERFAHAPELGPQLQKDEIMGQTSGPMG